MLILNLFNRKKTKKSLILDEFFVAQPKKMKSQSISTLVNKIKVEKKQNDKENNLKTSI
jgi:hypothetical protein